MPYRKGLLFIVITMLLLSLVACNSREDKSAAPKDGARPSAAALPMPQPEQNVIPAPEATMPANLVVDVDGHKMTKEQLEAELIKRLSIMKDQVPQDRLQQLKTNIKKRLMEDFVIRNLLTDEIKRQKIVVADKEVAEAIDQLKSSLPKELTIEALMKKNQVTKEQMNEEIRLGISINKLVLASMDGQMKPTEKEMTVFYQKNKDKFKMPESVHVRHILVAKTAGDDEKITAEKKAQAEDLRKQVLGGADFAEVARKSSDCPSKQAGGDLGTFSRGQMVKPFEDAAFSQKKNEIGPVVETEFGYHIIQVLEKNSSKIMQLDNGTKEKIMAFLTQQKQQQAFESLVKKLRDKAHIVYYGK